MSYLFSDRRRWGLVPTCFANGQTISHKSIHSIHADGKQNYLLHIQSEWHTVDKKNEPLYAYDAAGDL